MRMRTLVLSALCLSPLCFAGSALAQTEGLSNSVPTRTINIGEVESIDGEVERPNMEMIEGNNGFNSTNLIPIRYDFVELMVQSAEAI